MECDSSRSWKSRSLRDSPGVFVITKLVHFFAKISVNAGIIHTSETIIFIDSGISAFSGEYLWNLAKERMRGEEDLYLILTHKDTDHCFGMNEIKRHGAVVLPMSIPPKFYTLDVTSPRTLSQKESGRSSTQKMFLDQ